MCERSLLNYRNAAIVIMAVIGLLVLGWKAATLYNWNPRYQLGQEIDRLNGIPVYFNGGGGQNSGRRLTPDGYNIGLEYQCVEFVKRYYYQRFGHKMPDSNGHAKHFLQMDLEDGALNVKRNLVQFRNGSGVHSSPDDLLVSVPLYSIATGTWLSSQRYPTRPSRLSSRIRGHSDRPGKPFLWNHRMVPGRCAANACSDGCVDCRNSLSVRWFNGKEAVNCLAGLNVLESLIKEV